MDIKDGLDTWTIISMETIPHPGLEFIKRLAYFLAPQGETIATHVMLISLGHNDIIPIPVPEPEPEPPVE